MYEDVKLFGWHDNGAARAGKIHAIKFIKALPTMIFPNATTLSLKKAKDIVDGLEKGTHFILDDVPQTHVVLLCEALEAKGFLTKPAQRVDDRLSNHFSRTYEEVEVENIDYDRPYWEDND